MPIAFVDESGNGQKVFVVGAIISMDDNIAPFSRLWSEALAAPPCIDYFKYSEASSFAGCFSGWGSIERDQKIKDLWTVMNQFILRGDAVAIPTAEYVALFKGLVGKTFDSPLHFGYTQILALSSLQLSRMNCHEKLEFIFDSLDEIQYLEIVENFRSVRHFEGYPDITNRFCRVPSVASDRDNLLLQAADLWVGEIRHALSSLSILSENEQRLRNLNFENRIELWNEEKLLNLITSTAEKAPKLGSIYETANQRSKRLARARKLRESED